MPRATITLLGTRIIFQRPASYAPCNKHIIYNSHIQPTNQIRQRQCNSQPPSSSSPSPTRSPSSPAPSRARSRKSTRRRSPRTSASTSRSRPDTSCTPRALRSRTRTATQVNPWPRPSTSTCVSPGPRPGWAPRRTATSRASARTASWGRRSCSAPRRCWSVGVRASGPRSTWMTGTCWPRQGVFWGVGVLSRKGLEAPVILGGGG
ncbi:hypothetical protein BJ170DRAFT_120383 [Xylariales sp. AK1849]|nr:hypothetical protein BJ170DRAFT_120383 [Xylariales sp. AK1849]